MKTKKSDPGCWQHRSGYNLGYKEGKVNGSRGGIKELYIDRGVKEGKNLNT